VDYFNLDAGIQRKIAHSFEGALENPYSIYSKWRYIPCPKTDSSSDADLLPSVKTNEKNMMSSKKSF
jgi:hypothetical protein